MNLQAVIFDLDGVVTDTSEYHYYSWQRLADEEGMAFDRQVNERLRGISRRASLEIILAENDRTPGEAEIAGMMARKNDYYVATLEEVTPGNLLPGVVELIRELRAADIRVALGSASKNARTVLERLGIAGLLDVVADGHSVTRTKPAPDLFLWAAGRLGVVPAFCAVVEDAEAGIDAALAAGMWAIGLGPAERVGHAHVRFDSLQGVTLADVTAGLEAAA
jgi:kojibiose phosphorylase